MGRIVIKGVFSNWLVIAMVTLFVVACSDPELESQNSLVSAKNYLAENSLRAAAIELKNALQVNPENAEARYELGLLNLKFGDYTGAIKEFRHALKAGWNEEAAYIGIAKANVSGNTYEKFIDEIEIKDHYSATTKAELFGLLAIAQTKVRSLDKAEQALRTGTSFDSNSLHTSMSSVQLSLLNGDVMEADTKLREALVAHPDNSDLLLLDTQIALRKEDKAGAIDALKKVLEKDPANLTTAYGREARLRLAGIQIFDDQLDQAQITLTPLFKQFNNGPETNYLGGLLAFRKGNYDLAEERLLKVLKVVPEHIQTQLLFGTLSFQKKNYEQAADYISRYLSDATDNLGARKLLGRTYMILGQSDKARKAFQPALESASNDAELLALIGLNDMRGGELLSGIENLKKAVETAPENQSFRQQLAKAYITSGNEEEAIKELNTILQEGGEKGNTQILLILAYLKADQPVKAIDTAEGILAGNPHNPAAMTLLGNVFMATGDQVKAREYLENALNSNPALSQASVSLARLEEVEGNISKAVAIYKGLADTEPKSVKPLLALARLADKQGDRDEFFMRLEQARALSPQDLPVRQALAEAYLREGAYSKADAVIKEAKKIAPDNNEILAQWGRLLVGQQRYEEALPVFSNLVATVPDSVFARMLLSEAYLKLGQPVEAKQQLTQAIEIQPDSIGLLAMLAKAENQLGRYESAEKYALRVQQINPDSYIGYDLAGDSWFGRQSYPDAYAAYQKAWERAQLSDLVIKLSTVTVHLGEQQQAIDLLQNWLNRHENDAAVRQLMANVLQSMGREAEAAAANEKVLALHPDNLVALNNLAVIYTKEKNPNALSLAERAYQIKPDNPSIKDTYGWILLQQGDTGQGRTLLKQAWENLSSNAEVRYHYAVALIRTGENAKGMEMLKQLLNEEKEFEGREDAEKVLAE